MLFSRKKLSTPVFSLKLSPDPRETSLSRIQINRRFQAVPTHTADTKAFTTTEG